MKSLLPLGRILMTPGAVDALQAAGQRPGDFLKRHVSGEWGELDASDACANRRAVDQGLRILSAYKTGKCETLWVITEHDRSRTTILLPSEY